MFDEHTLSEVAFRDEGPKKIQPPVSAGYEGLLFPPEQSEKIFVDILAQTSGYFKLFVCRLYQ
jgi:hypothetical protein